MKKKARGKRLNEIQALIDAGLKLSEAEQAGLARLVESGEIRPGTGRLGPHRPTRLKPGPTVLEMLDDERR